MNQHNSNIFTTRTGPFTFTAFTDLSMWLATQQNENLYRHNVTVCAASGTWDDMVAWSFFVSYKNALLLVTKPVQRRGIYAVCH